MTEKELQKLREELERLEQRKTQTGIPSKFALEDFLKKQPRKMHSSQIWRRTVSPS